MNKLIENFRCQEYLGEKYQLGLYHPHEAWMIFENKKSYVSDNGPHLIIGETFDDYQIEFCFRASRDGIWVVAGNATHISRPQGNSNILPARGEVPQS